MSIHCRKYFKIISLTALLLMTYSISYGKSYNFICSDNYNEYDCLYALNTTFGMSCGLLRNDTIHRGTNECHDITCCLDFCASNISPEWESQNVIHESVCQKVDNWQKGYR